MKFEYEFVQVIYGDWYKPEPDMKNVKSVVEAVRVMSDEGWTVESHSIESNNTGSKHILMFKRQIF